MLPAWAMTHRLESAEMLHPILQYHWKVCITVQQLSSDQNNSVSISIFSYLPYVGGWWFRNPPDMKLSFLLSKSVVAENVQFGCRNYDVASIFCQIHSLPMVTCTPLTKPFIILITHCRNTRRMLTYHKLTWDLPWSSSMQICLAHFYMNRLLHNNNNNITVSFPSSEPSNTNLVDSVFLTKHG